MDTFNLLIFSLKMVRKKKVLTYRNYQHVMAYFIQIIPKTCLKIPCNSALCLDIYTS